jgi:glycosyltransferase involved in cell wall biosynthesis
MQGRLAARRRDVPLVSTYHTLYNEYAHYFPLLPKAVTRRWLTAHVRAYYNRCDAVIVPSRAAGRVLEGLGVAPDLLHVVPTGVPEAPAVMPRAIAQARATFDLPPDAPVLLFVGRLAREKSLPVLVDAFARLVHRHDERTQKEQRGGGAPVLLLAGSGPYASACRRLVEQAGIAANVRFAGFLSRTQLAPVYAAATLFVFPSATETQGVVLSEAQSHGLPCVVVNGGGAPEFVRNGVDALIVPPGDPNAFTQAIQALLDDEERRRALPGRRAKARSAPRPRHGRHGFGRLRGGGP